MHNHSFRLAVSLCLAVGFIPLLCAELVSLPNASFESPATSFVAINFDAWQKMPKPDSYDESGGFLWSQLAGTFKNTAAGNADHIHNCHGDQALWLFAVPQAGLFQDYDSKAWNDATATHAFDAVFESGKSYQLTVGMIGGGGGMLAGVTMEIALYFRDAASNMVTVAATSITNASSLFPNTTNFVDVQVQIPTVKSGDPWAGRHIGVRMLSTVNSDLQGGYWDLDNIRLTSLRASRLYPPTLTNGQFIVQLQSEPGTRFELLQSTNLTLPISSWLSLGILSNTTGKVFFADASTNINRCFYSVRQLP